MTCCTIHQRFLDQILWYSHEKHIRFAREKDTSKL